MVKNELKQVILVRQDLKMPSGKLASQVAHAAVEAMLKVDKELFEAWKSQGYKKVVLKVQDKKELMQYLRSAKQAKIAVTLIRDAGRTVLLPGTVTTVGIGPDYEDKIDKITGELKPL